MLAHCVVVGISTKEYRDTGHSYVIFGSLLTKLKVIRRPILTQGLTLGTGVTLGGIGLVLFRMEW